MSDLNGNDNRDERQHLDDSQKLARDAVRGLDRPQADPDFRARLKAQFVEGRIPEASADSGLRVVDGTGDAPERPVAVAGGRRRALWGGLAAAAVVAVVLVSSWRLPGPELMDVAGGGSVTVDGTTIPASDSDALGRALVPGARVEVGEDATLDVAYRGSFFMRLESGADLVLPPRPGRWTGRAVKADLAAGEVSVRTSPSLAGGSLTVVTPQARTVIHGTLVSVVTMPDLSCICLFEGSAEVFDSDGRLLGALEAGKRWVVYGDDRAPEFLDIMPLHSEHMKAFDEGIE